MPYMYVAKVNLNSNIFEVYDKKLAISDVCAEIYKKFKDGFNYEQKNKNKFTDSLGNSNYFMQESNYWFQELNKLIIDDGRIITGKLVRRFNKPTEAIEEGKVIVKSADEIVSIYFYYDVDREMVAFCERQSFGYNQFMKAFTYTLNQSVDKYTFEMFLQKDGNMLQEKIKGLKQVSKVKAVLIPPNSNEKDLDELRSQLEYLQSCQETNAKRMNIEYSSDNMNMESKAMQDILKAVSRGYGEVTACGINGNNRPQIISSNQDAAQTMAIPDGIDEKGFNDEAKFFICSIGRKLKQLLSN